MKYAVFFVALLGMPALAFMLTVYRRWMKWVFYGMVAALCVYIPTSINFFSHEHYRGSARGMEVSVIHLLAVAVLMALAFRKKSPGFFPGTGAKLYFVYFLLCLPSWMTAANRLYSWFETWKMIMLHLVYLAIYGYLRSSGDVKGVLKALAAFTCFNFALVVKDHFQGIYQPHGVFPHQNGLAMAMHAAGGLFFAGYLMHGLRHGFGKFCAAACVCAAGATVRTYSRMAIALMPIEYGLVALFCAVGGRLGTWMKRIAPLAVLGFAAFAAILPRIVERFENAPEASKNTRIELARCAGEMIRDEPWRGIGINNWGVKINPPYDYAERAERETNRGEDFQDGIVETVYLLVGAECGLPALAAMVAWFGYYLFIAFRLMKRLAGTWYYFIPAGLAGGLAVIYGHSCFEWTLRMQQNLIVQLFFFAILEYLNTSWKELRAGEIGAGRAA